MAEFIVLAECDFLYEQGELNGPDGESFDCLEQACAAAGVYCARISRELADQPMALPASMLAGVSVLGFRGGQSYLHAEWNMRDDAWTRVKP